jgi:hypothetical protein
MTMDLRIERLVRPLLPVWAWDDTLHQFYPVFPCGGFEDGGALMRREGAAPSTFSDGALGASRGEDTLESSLGFRDKADSCHGRSGALTPRAIQSPVQLPSFQTEQQDAAERKEIRLRLALQCCNALTRFAEVLLGLSMALAFRFKLISREFEFGLEDLRLLDPENALYGTLQRFNPDHRRHLAGQVSEKSATAQIARREA